MARKIAWTDRAKADVRAIDAHTAMHILRGLARFLKTGEADIKRLHGIVPPQFRLRVADYRIRFYDHGDTIEILGGGPSLRGLSLRLDLESPILATLPWLTHGFGTRHPVEIPNNISILKQIHSNLVLMADHPGLVGEGDALVTNLPGLALAVRTADCFPILLADTRHRAVAAIHAGWRGTAAQIVIKTLEKMKSEFGTEPVDVSAATGPGIGVCCYEVGEDVSKHFGFAVRTHLDLVSENWKQLESVGVPAQNIQALGVCTFCDAERFFSYRREKDKAGRMTSFIQIRPEIKPR